MTDNILKLLIALYQAFGGNFGYAIIVFTLALRALLAPLSVPAIKTQKKMQELKPHLDKLKAQHGHDKAKFQQEQLKLYQEHKLNPLAGCLPYILQFIVLIALYQGLNSFLHTQNIQGVPVNTMFFGVDLAKPDRTYLLPILAGVTQLILSVMVLPGVESHDLIPDTVTSKKLKEANKKEGDTQEMAEAIQQQMVFMTPVITVFAALQFASGLTVYWVVSTVFSIVQQWVVSGPGGLEVYWRKAAALFAKRTGK